MSSSLPLSGPKADRKAYSDAVQALAPDMPLFMHGAGDVTPSDVNPETAKLLSELTVNYVAKLVDAAVDAHDLLTDGAGGVLPPPPLETKMQSRKRKMQDTDFWDEPLPEPKIKSSSSNDNNETKPVLPQDWVGVQGVDFWKDARSRRAHVSAPSAPSTQCFMFPICHDAALYGRVKELRSTKSIMAPDLTDRAWLEEVKEEGGRLTHASSPKHKSKQSNNNESEDEAETEDEENEEEELLPEWPGLDSLLPIHRGGA